jgi:hypothetical protein
MTVSPATFDITLRGCLDSALFALITEYDLDDVAATVTLRGLPLGPATLERLVDRTSDLGLTVERVRPGDGADDPPPVAGTANVGAVR